MALKVLTTALARLGAIPLLLLLLLQPSAVRAQAPTPPPPDQAFTPDQLNNLVAPIALYPDPLLSQILVAATYPLEVVQAYQWLQRTPGLTGPALTEAAQQQNWDASIQALVVFPDVLKRLNDDVNWTTNLGNAFLAQQQDVMDAVQRMRTSAQQAGKLQSSPQETVTATSQNGQAYVEIEPAEPDVIYVPDYDPVWIWGPAVWYPYPRWHWPARTIVAPGLFFGFGGPIRVGLFFGAGWHGWAGWGWHPGWGNRTIVVNNTFIHQHNFNATHVEKVHGTAVWVHDPSHRAGVPYANTKLQQQFRGNVRQNVAPRAIPEQARGPQPAERFGNRQIPKNVPPAQNRGMFSGIQNGGAARTHEEHGFSSLGAARSMPRQSAPASRPAPAPRAAPAPRPAPAARGGRR
ncbi:MAG TPA: DUF3300 domain-containing protein [Terriglobia bacterium]